ncbi:hypothetical protein AVDCRST_MAG94-1506 [uncultured Leptolyngbya sp.]|uniref:Uncharacterized protein n=1 Tax=uncultured Leptolyngbya sp. TaxID=332963 RepID=A0A6J4L2L3_9CYAN|nr:hypothetical protein AVDCRST_MAG94-1506 [uncultured Leptolyngbya sp.]
MVARKADRVSNLDLISYALLSYSKLTGLSSLNATASVKM